MDIKQIQAIGGLATRTVVERKVSIAYPPLKPQEEWEDPNTPESDNSSTRADWVEKTVTVHVRKRSASEAFEIMSAPEKERPFLMILRCICKEDGELMFDSIEQVEQLKDWLWIPFSLVASEVNDLTEKKSRPRTNDGAVSRSPSGAGRSTNGGKRSVKRSSSSGLSTNGNGVT